MLLKLDYKNLETLNAKCIILKHLGFAYISRCYKPIFMKKISSFFNSKDQACNNIFGLDIGAYKNNMESDLATNLQDLQSILNKINKFEIIDNYITNTNGCFILASIAEENVNILEGIFSQLSENASNIFNIAGNNFKYFLFKSLDAEILKSYSYLQDKHNIEHLYCIESDHIFDIFLSLVFFARLTKVSQKLSATTTNDKTLKIIEMRKNTSKPFCLFSLNDDQEKLVSGFNKDLNITLNDFKLNNNILFGSISNKILFKKINNLNNTWLNYFN